MGPGPTGRFHKGWLTCSRQTRRMTSIYTLLQRSAGAVRYGSCRFEPARVAPPEAPRRFLVAVTPYAYCTLLKPVFGLRSRRLQVRTLSGILLLSSAVSMLFVTARANW